ncbi:MAG: tRNA 2-thiouridine(34) synthase MnmA [Candidatus Wolfebacteria bacterium]|nr:tRNA 2-thiouridine(34) synthase MnmA [Candidatus Wolfebacteria bacterium]
MVKKSYKKITVFVMMSGGVDSSVAAFLLQKQGYKVIGCFIKGYNLDGCQEKDAEDARRVAEYLNIPFYAIDLENEYKKLVVDYTVRSYRKGITPNPDVMCNKEIKFGLFLKKAIELGADYVATGHYVRLNRSASPLFSLFAAKDKNKDQSYFLWTLNQNQLKRCLFPIGDYEKPMVRKIAKKAGLPTAEKKDSQGICFLGKISMEDFLKKFISPKKGKIVNLEGEKIGEHQGVYFYTIGQRHGLGIAAKKPFYVAEKDAVNNIIKVAEGRDDQNLFKKEVYLKMVNWLSDEAPKKKLEVLARVRYRQPLFEANFYPGISRLEFKNPQKFVAPGQSAVLYNKKGEMLGGGIIV